MINADCIRGMNDEELARFFDEVQLWLQAEAGKALRGSENGN